MRYLMTFIWAVLLLQMVNFVLNSLNSGPILDPILKPSKGSSQYES
ncbi:MAG: DUF2929 family protein [Staphylococcus epidermidis]|nr:DUF2929 family protein [Staphylococcus epidermidis]